MKEYIHLALATNSNYIIPTTVLLKSVFDIHKGNVIIYILYLENSLSSEEISFLTDYTVRHGNKLIELEVKACDLAGFPETRHGKAALLRLLLPKLLPEQNKVLYLDGDTVVVDDLKSLYETDIYDYYIAAVKDTAGIYNSDYVKSLDIDNPDSYFNTGVVLMNLSKMREINLVGAVSEFARAHYDKICAPDQDALNYICQGKTLYLHPRYNMNYLVEKDIAYRTWGKTQVYESKKHPCIIHYIGPVKPWSVFCVHPRRNLWWKILQTTPFKNFTPKDYSFKNKIYGMYLVLSKIIERQFTLESKRKIGRLIPESLKRNIKKSLLKKV